MTVWWCSLRCGLFVSVFIMFVIWVCQLECCRASHRLVLQNRSALLCDLSDYWESLWQTQTFCPRVGAWHQHVLLERELSKAGQWGRKRQQVVCLQRYMKTSNSLKLRLVRNRSNITCTSKLIENAACAYLKKILQHWYFLMAMTQWYCSDCCPTPPRQVLQYWWNL